LVRISSQDFRQILFINGFIRTNRLIHLESEMADEQMPILIQEVNLLEKFARSQKILGATEKINIFYLAKDDDECQIALLAFQNSVFSNQSHPRSFVSMQSLVSDVHMSEISGRLMALTLGNAQFKSDYYPKIVQQVEAVKKTTWALWITWTIGVLFLLGYCFSYLTHEYETEKVIHQLNQVEQTHQNYIARYMNNYEVPYLGSSNMLEEKGFKTNAINEKFKENGMAEAELYYSDIYSLEIYLDVLKAKEANLEDVLMRAGEEKPTEATYLNVDRGDFLDIARIKNKSRTGNSFLDQIHKNFWDESLGRA
jgi:hypothetical protein